MSTNKQLIVYSLLLIVHLLSGCTLKLSTDLSKVFGIDNPKQLMGSSEVQQIATRIGEGMGTKIMEGEILAEDMGKGLGEVFLRPEQVALIKDPVSIDLIEKSGMADIRAGKCNEAIDSFKRTHNLARLEEIALILFDKGKAAEAADLHQYLIEHAWPIRAPYLVARRIEALGLATLSNAHLKAVDPLQYNLHYTKKSHTILDTASLSEEYIKHNTITEADMLHRIKTAPVIILADTFFDTKQHSFFLEIITALFHNDLVIGLEEQLERLRNNRPAAEKLSYLPLFTFIEEKGVTTFIHGPPAESDAANNPRTVDFFGWDSALADTVSGLLSKGKQVLLIVGSTHASTDHLPFLIEDRSGVNPVLLVQCPLALNVEQLFAKQAALRSTLAAWGAGDGSVITIENDFYRNVPLSPEDFEQYIRLFDLQPLLQAR